ncbi:MAG TPA: calcium-binding protein, partial [Novosphingobium sp.]|nr:calcium-binding protein [Novosphingobium sp.]
ARNLDRALELQFKTGDSREFNLRNFAIDFATLDEVGSSDDSTYRVELLTPAQFHFAMGLSGIDFRPEMLTATLDPVSGLIDYRVVEGGSYSLSQTSYQSVIAPMIELTGMGLSQYYLFSMRFSVRMALQGGLADFARGIEYDFAADKYRPTTSRELAPLFEAIFEGAPASNENDAIYDYFVNWSTILLQVYPDYQPADPQLPFDPSLGVDQSFIFQMLLSAFENVGTELDLLAVANAFGLDERRIITHEPDDAVVRGGNPVDFFYLTGGNQTIIGSYDANAMVFDRSPQIDIYFIGKDAGDDHIYDRDLGDVDQVRFVSINSTDVKAVRDGQDLVLFYNDGANFLRVTDQFLGELNMILQDGTRLQTGVDEIVFADGVVWNRYRMSFAVVDFERAALDESDALYGSGSGDILYGGRGNDYMSGGLGGDTYIFQLGDGRDVIDDLGGFSFGRIEAGIDFLMCPGEITEDRLLLLRDGPSENLLIVILDENGVPTGDSVEIVGQFGGLRLNLALFGSAVGSSAGLDYIAPNLIEKIIFERGGLLDFETTEGDDAIYGLLNDNTLDGGAGDDFLSGRQGFDTYLYGRNYGKDVILDADFSSSLFGPKNDLLRFLDDLRWTDFDFLRDGSGDTLRMRVKDTTDELILTDFLEEIFLVGYINLI